MKAIWRDTVIADSEDVVEVDGIPYFPLADVAVEFLEATDSRSEAPGKGAAAYFSIVVGDEVNPDAVWTYPKPGPDSLAVRDRVAFGLSVSIVADPAG